MAKPSQLEKLAFRFVLIIGITNLFADMTYEGARGISGPFLGSLGASAAVVGFVAGAGELLGYESRFGQPLSISWRERETATISACERSFFLNSVVRRWGVRAWSSDTDQHHIGLQIHDFRCHRTAS
jgi:hypothetical protein